jgi:hypothetical protein
MSDNHIWHQRLYGDPDEGRIAVTREELVMWTKHRIDDAIGFGEYIYTEMIEPCEEPFNGTFEWFALAFEHGWIMRPRRGAWPASFVKQSLTIVNGHTAERFDEWLATKKGTKGISFQGYCKWLDTKCQWAPTLARTDRQRMLIRSHRSSVR